MNYYQHHIGDFRAGTVHMSRTERWIYRDLIDVYYDTEQPLPLDLDELCRAIGVRTDDERTVVIDLLKFKFQKTDAGYPGYARSGRTWVQLCSSFFPGLLIVERYVITRYELGRSTCQYLSLKFTDTGIHMTKFDNQAIRARSVNPNHITRLVHRRYHAR